MYKPSLFTTISKTIAELQSKGKWSTAEHHIALLNSIKRYRDSKDLRIHHLTRSIVLGYQEYLMSSGIAQNSVSFYMRMFRAVYNRAVEDFNLQDLRPFKKATTNNQRTQKRAISLEIIKKIANLDLSKKPRLQKTRDIFMFLFYTRGMSLVDAAHLCKTDIKNGILYYKRKKTGRMLAVQWENEMQAIADRYYNPNSPYILPILDNERNSHRDYKSRISSINRNLRKIADMVGLKTPLTTYVSRHSWATIARDQNVPIAVISEGMGHNSMTTTQIYLASIDMEDVHKANADIMRSLN